jgi:diaminohydroxyphosphoribosylaminopyrimidine deaminase / 5-amino-6-(5-phosphoribosylamino)uracil reductase
VVIFAIFPMTEHEIFMERCIGLAQLGEAWVAPNPMVGAVLVHEGRIIGEGWHAKYGESHAEVNCINSVKERDRNLIEHSTLYVSLEPCAHFGKTPPCTNLIIEKKIPRVVIGCKDPFGLVDGKGIDKLKWAEVEVITGVLEQQCRELNKRFFSYFETFRPFITLKWAQSADAQIAGGSSRVKISNPQTDRLVHKWRSEEMAVLVGTNTALFDDPELTTRLWPGRNPLRLVLDMRLRLPFSLKLFDGVHKTVVFNRLRDEEHRNLRYMRLDPAESIPKQIVKALRELKVQSVLIEGGAQLLQTFINEGYWNEARIITSQQLVIGKGIAAPVLKSFKLTHTLQNDSDIIQFFRNTIHPANN